MSIYDVKFNIINIIKGFYDYHHRIIERPSYCPVDFSSWPNQGFHCAHFLDTHWQYFGVLGETSHFDPLYDKLENITDSINLRVQI